MRQLLLAFMDLVSGATSRGATAEGSRDGDAARRGRSRDAARAPTEAIPPGGADGRPSTSSVRDPQPRAVRPAVTGGAVPRRGGSTERRPSGAARRPTRKEAYAALAEALLREHGVRVRRWRSSTSGMAWETHRDDGVVNRWIEAPFPRGPMSLAVFLHEIGHHAIGFNTYRIRCLEEFHAWRWALEAMESAGFPPTDAVRRRMDEALEYAVAKAVRRGIRRLPVELIPYADERVRRAATARDRSTAGTPA